jgi:Kef-type K+ transport system membrane component KefB
VHAFGMESSDAIDWIADIGTLLLLVGVGLKLQLKTLAKPAVWVATSSFSIGAMPASGLTFLGVGGLVLPLASNLDLHSAAAGGSPCRLPPPRSPWVLASSIRSDSSRTSVPSSPAS